MWVNICITYNEHYIAIYYPIAYFLSVSTIKSIDISVNKILSSRGNVGMKRRLEVGGGEKGRGIEKLRCWERGLSGERRELKHEKRITEKRWKHGWEGKNEKIDYKCPDMDIG